MSPSPRATRSDDPRACPRCSTTVRAEQGYGASGVTYLWRCDCGWSSVRTVSARRTHRSGVYIKPTATSVKKSAGS